MAFYVIDNCDFCQLDPSHGELKIKNIDKLKAHQVFTILFYYNFFTREANLRDHHMLHCYKIEFNFLQKKFSKHSVPNIAVYAYIAK